MKDPEVIESLRASSREYGGGSIVVQVRGHPHYVLIEVWLDHGEVARVTGPPLRRV